jgi:hypothetical protein
MLSWEEVLKMCRKIRKTLNSGLPAFVLLLLAWLIFFVIISCAVGESEAGTVSGELKKWHKVTVTFDGPNTSEGATPNPFTDYRLNVTFTNGSRTYKVPGYYAADGNAAETSATGGNKWRVHFTPDETGTWTYAASFRQGSNIAIDLNDGAGTPVSFDGASGHFNIGSSDKGGRDHRGKGRLKYVNGHYLRFSETGEYFLKGGANSPENFLAYYEFDNTYKAGEAGGLGIIHHYDPHLNDWQTGDPTWQGEKGKRIIGALNYLSGKGMNSVYFLIMNRTGDGDDTWPWTGHDERYHFDCSKLDQWEVVFKHMDRKGLMLHVVTQETENDQLLDGGNLGNQRKLYYREIIARFAHHLAITWNLGEENTNTDQQRKDFAWYIHEVDPYDHMVVCHTVPGDYDQVYNPLLGYGLFEGPSLQLGVSETHSETLKWINNSGNSGRKWVVCLDEIGPWHTGVVPDANDYWHNEVRYRGLYGNLMAGGAGVEWYFGYNYDHMDVNCEDWRSRDHMWDLTRYALEFFQKHLPFPEMESNDGLSSAGDDYCFAKYGQVYAIYLPYGGSTDINLDTFNGTFPVKWYNPRTGGGLQDGSVTFVTGPGWHSIGNPPSDQSSDWVVLVGESSPSPSTPPGPAACGG